MSGKCPDHPDGDCPTGVIFDAALRRSAKVVEHPRIVQLEADLAAARAALERMGRLLDWCKPRLKREAYAELLDRYRAEFPEPDHTRIISNTPPRDQAMTTARAELLPCPFCGGAASPSVGHLGDGSPWHYVECIDCTAQAEPHIWNRRDESALLAERRRAIEAAAKVVEVRAVCLRPALSADASSDINARISAVIHNLERCAEIIRSLASPREETTPSADQTGN